MVADKNEIDHSNVISKHFIKLLDTIMVQSQVLQSTMWNTISPQKTQRPHEIKSGGSRHPGNRFNLESDDHQDEQRRQGRESRRDQYISRSKQQKLQQRLTYEQTHRDDVTACNERQHVDNGGTSTLNIVHSQQASTRASASSSRLSGSRIVNPGIFKYTVTYD